MRIKPFQAIHPNFDYITSMDAFFDRVKFDYLEYRNTGFFKKTAQESLFVLEITRGSKTHTGLIASVDIRDYSEGRIKRHENTLAAKEQQQMHLLISRNAVLKPVLVTYQDVGAINTLISNQKTSDQLFAEAAFEKSGEVHKLWQIRDGQTVRQLQDFFLDKVPATFIADGHHRCSTSAILYDRMKGEDNSGHYLNLLTAFFPKSQLEVHDYNRIIEGLNEQSFSQFVAKLSMIFNIKPLKKGRKPKKKHELTIFFNNEWYSLEWRKKILDKYKSEPVILDATLLDRFVLEDILGIEDIRSDVRMKYVDGPSGLNEFRTKVLKNEKRIGFCLFPVELEDLIKVASANDVMPPKSTWFEPRIKNGLTVLEFEPKKI